MKTESLPEAGSGYLNLGMTHSKQMDAPIMDMSIKLDQCHVLSVA